MFQIFNKINYRDLIFLTRVFNTPPKILTKNLLQELLEQLLEEIILLRFIFRPCLHANGGFYTDSGTESIQDFRNAVLYLSYNVPKDGNDRSTDLVVRVAFDTTIPTDITQMNLLMFQTYRKFCAVKVRGGQVISVNSQYN